jgi:hypothetical protein
VGPVKEIFDFATTFGSTRIIVGGSFVTAARKPHDLDCVIVFEREEQIPDRTERVTIEGTQLDVFFCAEDQPQLVGAFVAMFARTRTSRETGIVEVDILNTDGRALWDVIEEPSEQTLDLVRTLYFNRHVFNQNTRAKALITIHGIRSHGEWNAEICHIASSNGWIVAPFTYGYVEPTVFANPSQRAAIVDRFRDHINDISDRYSAPISVIAHSFGTYVIAKYLLGFDEPPVPIDTLILTGSILNEEMDIDQFKGRAFKIINEVAPNDGVVKLAVPASLWSDPMLGRSGEVGFKKTSNRLEQRECDVFSHTNVIRRDVVSRRWMPWLELNVGQVNEELTAKF